MFKEIVQGMLIGLGILAAAFITILMALLAWSFIADDGVESYSRAQQAPTEINFYSSDHVVHDGRV